MKKGMRKKGQILVILLLVLICSVYIYNFLDNSQSYAPCIRDDYSIEKFLEKNSNNLNEYYYYSEKYDENDLVITGSMNGGRQVNSMEGLSSLPYAADINNLQLSNTCIKQIDDLEALTNLEVLSLSGTNVSSMEGIENMNNLTQIHLRETDIDTIENVENIRTDTKENLKIFLDSATVHYITKESYDYIINPKNNVTIALFGEGGMIDLQINTSNGGKVDYDEISEYLEIV